MMKRSIPVLDPPPRKRRTLTAEEKQLWEAEIEGKITPAKKLRTEKIIVKDKKPAPEISLPKLAPLHGKKALKKLDLHGSSQAVAYAKVCHFLEQAQLSGIGTVHIITGKGGARGEGILRTQLPRWLEETALRALIIRYDNAAPHHGGEGAWVINIRKLKQ